MTASIDRVTVERDGDEVVIGWDSAAPAVIYAGPTPESIRHDRPLAEGNSPVRVIAPAQRSYFFVAPRDGIGVIAAERLVALDGTMNFRDLGGYRTGDGRRVRWGRVFRSDELSGLTDADVTALRHLGLRVIHDFRFESERVKSPSRLPEDEDIEEVLLTIGGAAAETVDVLDILMRGEGGEYGLDWMVEMYGMMLDTQAPVFGHLITSLADPGRLPALFHCTAGKDRTGIAAALLLGVLGVDHESILDDYELTTHYRSERRIEQLRAPLEAAGVDIESVRPFLSAPRPALADNLFRITDAFGSIEGFVLARAGVKPDVLVRLRDLLLE
jgi:protein-tyrosine phosphatase